MSKLIIVLFSSGFFLSSNLFAMAIGTDLGYRYDQMGAGAAKGFNDGYKDKQNKFVECSDFSHVTSAYDLGSFAGHNAVGARFRVPNLFGVMFATADLSFADFSKAALRNSGDEATNFNAAILRGTNFTLAKSYGVGFDGAKLNEAIFFGASFGSGYTKLPFSEKTA
jgi:hypothetical protein